METFETSCLPEKNVPGMVVSLSRLIRSAHDCFRRKPEKRSHIICRATRSVETFSTWIDLDCLRYQRGHSRYQSSGFHRAIPNFMVQGGRLSDFEGTSKVSMFRFSVDFLLNCPPGKCWYNTHMPGRFIRCLGQRIEPCLSSDPA